MKLAVFSAVLLVVPLALALPPPFAKFVYNSESMIDHVLTEVSNATLVRYGYETLFKNPSNLTFAVFENTTGIDYHSMLLKGDVRAWNVSFVVEAYRTDPNVLPDNKFCVENSDASLRPLIAECFSKIVLRNLTTEERTELQKSKSGWVNFFKVVYDKQLVKARSSLLNQFKLSFSQKWVPFLGKFNYGFNVSTQDHTYRPRAMGFRSTSLAESSFVVAGMPTYSVSDCYETQVPHLKATWCEGDIQLKPYYGH